MQGNIGLLDANSREYTTLMRSHTCSVRSVSVSERTQHLVTCSEDHTIRVWDLHKAVQVLIIPYIYSTCIYVHAYNFGTALLLYQKPDLGVSKKHATSFYYH